MIAVVHFVIVAAMVGWFAACVAVVVELVRHDRDDVWAAHDEQWADQ